MRDSGRRRASALPVLPVPRPLCSFSPHWHRCSGWRAALTEHLSASSLATCRSELPGWASVPRQPHTSSQFHSDLLVILSKLRSSVGFSSCICKIEFKKPVSCRFPVEPGRPVRCLGTQGRCDWKPGLRNSVVSPYCPSQVAACLLAAPCFAFRAGKLLAPGSLNPS